MPGEVVTIPYGADDLRFRVNHDAVLAGVFTPHPAPPAPDPEGVIREALADPVDCARLREAAADARSALILVDDITRETPTHLLVPAILEELRAGGLPDDAVQVMIALGTHRPMTPDEVRAKLGDEVLSRVEVTQHDHTVAPLRDLGTTPDGTPVHVNAGLFETDLVIGTGAVVPHHIAGFSAGAKIVQPGVSGAATTAATHMFSARAVEPLLGQVVTPVRREMERIAERSGMRHVLNVTLNCDGQLVTARFGTTRGAYRRAVADAQSIYGVPAPTGLDIVIAGSHPCDIEFWQAHKSLYPAAMLVRPGGTIVVVTPCPEGVAVMHPEMLDYAASPADALITRYENGEFDDPVAASLATAWARVREHARIILVSDGVAREDARALAFDRADTVEAALEMAAANARANPSVGVLTHAPDTLPLTN